MLHEFDVLGFQRAVQILPPVPDPDDGYILIGQVKVHRTALVGFQPMAHSKFARPLRRWPAPLIGDDVMIGPQAIVYAGCSIDDGTVVCPRAHIREGTRIGKRCLIGLEVKIGFDCEIRENTEIVDGAHISGGTIIGSGCFISVGVIIVNDDRPGGYEWKGVTPVTVGQDVVLGAGSMIRPAVCVGAGSTVAMGAVVAKDVPPGGIAKGQPATIEDVWPESACGAVVAAIGPVCM